jgi:hypothetical protein
MFYFRSQKGERMPVNWSFPLLPNPEEGDLISLPIIDGFGRPADGVIPAKGVPRDPECDEEWRQAERNCREWLFSGRLGRRFSGLGRELEECIRGQVSERCGGNPVAPKPTKPNPPRPGRRR